MSSMANSQIITKEISKGILLHKQHLFKEDKSNASEFVYIFKVEVKALQILDFTADFTGSENLTSEGSKDLIMTTTIQPFTTETVAILRLYKNWKLRSRFRFTMRSPPKEVQYKFLLPQYEIIKNNIDNARELLQFVPISVMSLQEVELILRKNKVKFLDIDFPPTDKSVFGYIYIYIYCRNIESPFDTLIEWRRAEDFMKQEIGDQKEICIFNTNIEVSDLKEGALGNGWFISALGTLAELPPLVYIYIYI